MSQKNPYPELTLLGSSGEPAQNHLETFPAPNGLAHVTLTIEEFTSICPVTGQPDYGTISIKYAPREFCVESKSLKLYAQTFRDQGIFWEKLATQVAEDLVRALSPRWVEVTTHQAARGGISIDSVCWLEFNERTSRPVGPT